MMTLLLVLLTITAGSAFAWYRIKTRGLATVFEDVRRFIAIQNSKDVAAYKATRRGILRLWDKVDEYGKKLDEQHQQREKERPVHRKEVEKQSQEYARQEFLHESQRRDKGDWRRRNLPSNTPQWYKDLDNAVWEFSLILGIGIFVILALMLLFIISINMG